MTTDQEHYQLWSVIIECIEGGGCQLVITYQETGLLHLRGTAQEGSGQLDLAQPPHERWSLLHGGRDVVQGCFLVGNNQLTSPTPYTLYYYLPELVMVSTSCDVITFWRQMIWHVYCAFLRHVNIEVPILILERHSAWQHLVQTH